MRNYPLNSPQAAARVVALLLISDGHVCSSEFNMLKRMGAERELGLEPGALPLIVQTLCEEMMAGGYDTGSLMTHVDEPTLASLMAEVSDPALQRTVLGLCLAAVQADDHVGDGEAMVVAAACHHWGLDDGEEAVGPASMRHQSA